MWAEQDPQNVLTLLPTFNGKLAFDVGANVGQSALVFAEHFDQVISIEPCRESYKVLKEYVPANVLPVSAAASDHCGVVKLMVEEYYIAQGQLTSGSDKEGSRSTRMVPAVTLDALAMTHGYPDFVKIDVEGHEIRVLKGAKKVLARKPRLYIEIHAEELGKQAVDILHPLYPELELLRHGHYGPENQWWKHHFWLVAA